MGQPNRRTSNSSKRAINKKNSHHRRKKSTANKVKPQWKRGRTWLFCLFVLLLSWWLYHFCWSVNRMDGYGMMPTIQQGDWLAVSKHKQVKRHSLIAIRNTQGEYSIRRVIGLSGETISYRQDTLYVDGKEMPERFLEEQIKEAHTLQQLVTADFDANQIPGLENDRIPENSYLVLGDNRPYVSDSRFYGVVDSREVIGVVSYRLLPIHQMARFN